MTIYLSSDDKKTNKYIHEQNIKSGLCYLRQFLTLTSSSHSYPKLPRDSGVILVK